MLITSHDAIYAAACDAMSELLERAGLRPGSLVVVGCSSSEIMGSNIGKGSTPEAAQAVYEAVVAALFLDGGIEAAEGFVRAIKLLRPRGARRR